MYYIPSFMFFFAEGPGPQGMKFPRRSWSWLSPSGKVSWEGSSDKKRGIHNRFGIIGIVQLKNRIPHDIQNMEWFII